MALAINPNDIVHNKYNRLYVESYAGKEKGYHLYNCICDCGNKCIVRRNGLLSNHTKSCGCYNIEVHSSINPDDLLHKKIGRLYTIYWFKSKGDYYYHCICDCGNFKDIRRDGLLEGKMPSCGCALAETTANINKIHNLTSNKIDHDFYNSYIHMIHRCLNEKDAHYNNYGGRGIFVCNEWIGTPGFKTVSKFFGIDGLEKFKEDMYDEFIIHKSTHSTTQIDRKNNDDGYYKENCRWVTAGENANNTRNSIYIEYNNEVLSFPNLYKKYGDKRIPYEVVYRRYTALGWNLHDSLYIHVNDNLRSPIHFFDPNVHQ